MKRFLSFIIFVFCLSTGLVGLSVWKEAQNGRLGLSLPAVNSTSGFNLAQAPAIDLKSIDALAASSRARVALAKAVTPAVVSISSTKKLPPQQRRFSQDPLFRFFFGEPGNGNEYGNDQDDDENEGAVTPFGGRQGNRSAGIAARALGSGVIVSKEGHILTNNHVIEGMDQIEVELNDHRTFKAEVIGADPATDLAVLKINTSNIAMLPFGDSDKVEVGESVLAIGNPYGLEETVTQGIISAKGRPASNDNLNDFFQIDAAINPGNSGGALINVYGELIGINAAIFSQSGGFQGVGFAIPSNTAKLVLNSLLKNGRVIRGYLGVNLRPLSADEAKGLQLPDAYGALVAGVQSNSPAEKGGMKPGDFIRQFNNKKIDTINTLRREVTSTEVNQTIPVQVLRSGKEVNLKIQIVEPPRTAQLASQFSPNSGVNGANPLAPNLSPRNANPNGSNLLPDHGPLAGIEVQDLTPPIARRLLLPDNVAGVVVSEVNENTPAFGQVRRGDIIEAINQQPVDSAQQYQQVIKSLNDNSRVAISIIRNRARSFIVIAP